MVQPNYKFRALSRRINFQFAPQQVDRNKSGNSYLIDATEFATGFTYDYIKLKRQNQN